jgi:hypothetical protein
MNKTKAYLAALIRAVPWRTRAMLFATMTVCHGPAALTPSSSAGMAQGRYAPGGNGRRVFDDILDMLQINNKGRER